MSNRPRKSESDFTRAFRDLALRALQTSRSGHEVADVQRLISAGITLLRDYQPHLMARAPLVRSGYGKGDNLYISLAGMLGPIVLGSLVENDIMLEDHIDILNSLLNPMQ